ncbi:MAG: mechanosensitive ion channel family protein [Bacteroidetes bacterium]|nr:mechanosensitive ion channel family protein [Bacteroidota bacterium]
MDKIQPYLIEFGHRIMAYAPRIIGAILIFIIGLWIINYISKLINQAMNREGMDTSLRSFLSSLISVGLKIFLIITAAGVLGIQTTSFVAVLGAAGLAVGLALQGSLANFAGGVLTLTFKPYVVGDVIETLGQVGEVKEIQIFNTVLLTPNNKTVILPNGAVSNGTIINQTRHGNLRVEFIITVGNDVDLPKVREIILSAVNAHPKVLKMPAATVDVVKLLGGITLAVHPYCVPSDTDAVSSEVQEAVNVALEKNGIHAPVPAAISINRNG